MNFKDKTVLVTGSNRGIGKALVQALLKKDVKKIYATMRSIKEKNEFNDARVELLELDITNAEQIKNISNIAKDIDVLINNAGVAEYISILNGPMGMIERDMNTNYYGTLKMMRAFIPVLEKKNSSIIANVVSIAAFVNFPFLGGYCASKAALFSLTQGARIELAQKGISVHSINPGPIDTDMASQVSLDKASPEETAEIILNELENGTQDIFPDPTGKGMFDLWCEDYKKLENAVSEMVANA